MIPRFKTLVVLAAGVVLLAVSQPAPGQDTAATRRISHALPPLGLTVAANTAQKPPSWTSRKAKLRSKKDKRGTDARFRWKVSATPTDNT